MKLALLLVTSISILVACNIKKSDVIADDNKLAREQAIKDTTTVQVIDTVYDFGTVVDGEKVEYNFRFKNSGDKPLVISNVSASCGCTTPEKPEKPIKPGEMGFIKAVFDSKGREGRAEKTITVTANVNPAFPDIKLVGEVLPKAGAGHSKDDGHGH